MTCVPVLTLLLLQAVLLQVFPLALAQIPVNGQSFTRGISIINAPNLNSEYHAGSPLPISIDVSGDGKLPSAAYQSGSGLPTSYDQLNIFLVSSQTLVNLTVSSGPDLLNGETGTVRHLNWPIPTCVSNGIYNLTFYETSHINDVPVFAITPLPITIHNDGVVNPCHEGTNALASQPQSDSPFPQSPFLPGGQTSITTSGSNGGKQMGPKTITVTVSGGTLPWDAFQTESWTNPASITTVTAVVISATTITTTDPGQATPTTLTSSTTWTTTAVMSTQDLSGFEPVNGSCKLAFPFVSYLYICFMLFIQLFSF